MFHGSLRVQCRTAPSSPEGVRRQVPTRWPLGDLVEKVNVKPPFFPSLPKMYTKGSRVFSFLYTVAKIVFTRNNKITLSGINPCCHFFFGTQGKHGRGVGYPSSAGLLVRRTGIGRGGRALLPSFDPCPFRRSRLSR